MSKFEKQIGSEANEGALYPVHDKNEATLSPSSDSDISQDVHPSINEHTLLRKLDRTLLPAVTLLYLLSFLDRSNGMVLLPHHPFSLHLSPCLSGQCARRGSGGRLAYVYAAHHRRLIQPGPS